jgi:glutathione synthase/RimK-type ligase-like ATP-grasp enzyme
MKNIYLLTDYLNRFGSKHDDFPYRSGMDKEKLCNYFRGHDYEPVFISFSGVDFRKIEMIGQPVLYTSQEDPDYFYKDYIEDIIFGLELAGANVIPNYKYLRANNNKVFMEIQRDMLGLSKINNIKSFHFGTIEEALAQADQFSYPVVVKGARGAMSRNVALAGDKKELHSVLKKLAATRNFKEELREIARSVKYEGYKRISKYRNKFIIQNFIPDLKNDWKVYVFGKKIYIFYRPIFKNRGFRASGGGYDNYLYGNEAKIPHDLLNYAFDIFEKLNVPFVSIDIAQSGEEFYLLEFQLVYFGTAGILKKYSKEFFLKENGKWCDKQNEGNIEKVYVDSVIEYLEK